MYAECPHCHAIFRVTEAILARAHGKVRCGECGQVFIATPAEGSGRPDSSQSSELLRSRPLDTPEPPPRPAKAPPSGAPAEGTSPPAAASAPPAEADEPPKYLPIEFEPALPQTRPARHGLRTLGWALLAVALMAVLAGQYLLAHRFELAVYPELRPLLGGLCRVAGCELPPRRALERIRLLGHSVYTHPTRDHALRIRARLVNRADFPQPWPVVEITFADLQGRPVASRRFTPDEYLPDATERPPLMPPGRSFPLVLDVVDPGPRALAFEFHFY